MKKLLFVLSFSALLVSCGGGTEDKNEDQTEETTELTAEEEETVANELSDNLQSETEHMDRTTERNLHEVDSLLEKL